MSRMEPRDSVESPRSGPSLGERPMNVSCVSLVRAFVAAGASKPPEDPLRGASYSSRAGCSRSWRHPGDEFVSDTDLAYRASGNSRQEICRHVSLLKRIDRMPAKACCGLSR